MFTSIRNVVCLLGAGLALSVGASNASAVVVADVKDDFGNGVISGDTSATVNPTDTLGTGRWDYFQTDTFGSSGSGSLTLLEWDNTQKPSFGGDPVAPGRYERAGVDHNGGSQFDFPIIADHGGYGSVANASEILVHPSDSGNSGGGTETKGLVRWTAGAGAEGLGIITGSVRRPSGAASGGQMRIFVDGVELFDSGVLLNASANFVVNASLTNSSVVDFVFDPVSNQHNDDSIYLSADINVDATSRRSGVFVPNASFENHAGGTGGANGDISVWQNPSGCCDGAFVAPGFGQDAAPTDGNQAAFMNIDVGQIFQTLADTYEEGNAYELSVDVSARGGPGTEQMLMVLYEGTITGLLDLNASNILASRVLDGAAGVVADEFNTFALLASQEDVFAAMAAGEQIGIGFFGLNTGTGTSDFDLDNVRLVQIIAAVPEPTTIALGLMGVAGLLVRRRRA